LLRLFLRLQQQPTEAVLLAEAKRVVLPDLVELPQPEQEPRVAVVRHELRERVREPEAVADNETAELNEISFSWIDPRNCPDGVRRR